MYFTSPCGLRGYSLYIDQAQLYNSTEEFRIPRFPFTCNKLLFSSFSNGIFCLGQRWQLRQTKEAFMLHLDDARCLFNFFCIRGTVPYLICIHLLSVIQPLLLLTLTWHLIPSPPGYSCLMALMHTLNALFI